MKKITYIYLALMTVLSACSKKESLQDESVIKDDTDAKTALDTYIYNQFVAPYNIGVTYKYVDANYDMSRLLYPPTESKVQPFLEMIKDVWIGSYVQVAGANFVKQIAPREIALIGGKSLDPIDDTETLGTADNGVKITLFRVDHFNYDDLDSELVKLLFHTIQHEYCHIINQKKAFSPDFAKITPANYTSTWFNLVDEQANALGFITSYAMANPLEDFAEMTSMMLLQSKSEWDAKIDAMPDTGKAAIKKKEAFIVDYFKGEWDINFYELQAIVYQRMQNYL